MSTPAAARRPRLRRSVDPRLTPDGAAYILRGPDFDDLMIEGDPGDLALLFTLLDGTRTDAEVTRELCVRGRELGAGVVAEAVSSLIASGVVDDAAHDLAHLDPFDAERFQRQLAYFADLAGGAGEAAAAQARLRDATVCLLGMGGLGSWVAWALACAGVGTLVGVDGDRVELSNLNRQILFAEDQLGELKAVAAGRVLTAFNRRLRYRPVCERLDGEAAVARAIAGADFVVSSVDWPPHLVSRWVNAACFAAGVPYLAMSQHPPRIRVGPLYVPGEPGCFACQEAGYREAYPLFAQLEQAEQPVPPSATFGPACGAVGTLAANEVVAHVTGLHHPGTRGNALMLDLRTFDVEREPVEARAGCPVCATRPSRT